MTRRIYKLVPIAAAGDPNWERAGGSGIVLVRADSSGDARLVASEAEPDFLEIDRKPAHGASTRFASAFRDEKLYGVEECETSGHSPEGPREVVEGMIRNPLQD